MKVTAAEIENLGDHTALRITTDEGTAYIETPKQRVLQVAAIVSGPDVTAGKFPAIATSLPPDPQDGIPEALEVAPASQEPVVLELARRFATGALGDGVGPVTVPSFEEADAAVWRFEGGVLRKIAV